MGLQDGKLLILALEKDPAYAEQQGSAGAPARARTSFVCRRASVAAKVSCFERDLTPVCAGPAGIGGLGAAVGGAVGAGVNTMVEGVLNVSEELADKFKKLGYKFVQSLKPSSSSSSPSSSSSSYVHDPHAT